MFYEALPIIELEYRLNETFAAQVHDLCVQARAKRFIHLVVILLTLDAEQMRNGKLPESVLSLENIRTHYLSTEEGHIRKLIEEYLNVYPAFNGCLERGFSVNTLFLHNAVRQIFLSIMPR